MSIAFNEQHEIDTVEINLNDSMYELLERMSSVIEEKINSYYVKVQLEDVYLDPRGGGAFWVDTVNQECVVIRKCNKRMFDYYCGGEYVNKDNVFVIGEYAIYYADCDERVEGWIEAAVEATEER